MIRLTKRALLRAPLSGGQQIFSEMESFFVVPAGVTSICAVGIQPGQSSGYDGGEGYVYSGAGGGMAYRNNIPVTPGETLRVTVGIPFAGGSSAVLRDFTDLMSAGGSVAGQVRTSGGSPQFSLIGEGCAGGGAGGYGANGTQGPGNNPNGGAGSSLFGGSGAPAGGGNVGTTAGGTYGGGEGIFGNNTKSPGSGPGLGAVRIIWGEGRAYPNTNTADV